MGKFQNPAYRRYLARVAVAMSLYLISIFAAVRLVVHGGVGGPAAYALAVLPGLCIVAVFWAVARLIIEQEDEYQRMLLVRQTLVATGFSLSLASVWGFFEAFNLAPHIDAYYVAILWFAGLGIGALYNRLTLGDGGCS
jgi:FtsH-binding integral membrane protein